MQSQLATLDKFAQFGTGCTVVLVING